MTAIPPPSPAAIDGEPAPRPTIADAALRRAPRRDQLAAIAEAVWPGSVVARVERLRGGVASGMHAVLLRANGATGGRAADRTPDADAGAGPSRRTGPETAAHAAQIGAEGRAADRRWIVVRRFGRWRVEHDPAVAEREWAVLAALARVGAPTPRPLWLDPAGTVLGCPTIVTGRLAGRGLLAPADRAAYVRELATALAAIHAAPLRPAELAVLADQRAELAVLLERDAPPAALAARPGGADAWAMLRRWWPRTSGLLATARSSLVHGDFWPGNTLWRRGRLSGVVDWEQVRRGDPLHDVGCCRLDLTLLLGPDAADRFAAAYAAASGRPAGQLFFWELYMATSAIESLDGWVRGYHDLGRTDLSLEEARARLRQFTERALANAEAAWTG